MTRLSHSTGTPPSEYALETAGTTPALRESVHSLRPNVSARRVALLRYGALLSVLGLQSLFAIGCGGTEFTTSDDAGSGGSSSSGGADGSGGSPVVACEESEITFKLTTDSPDRSCLPSAGCGPTWITISDSTGNVMTQNGACTISCSDCSTTACPDVECTSQPFDRDVAFAWSGEFFAESECQGDQCVRPSCAPPGEYVAKICLERAVPPDEGATECIPAGQVECDEVPFTWPDPEGQSQIVTLTLGNQAQ